jgi:glutathione S-transferase
MRLHSNPGSPFVRKVMACAIARRIDDRIELLPVNPHESPVPLLMDNPLSKVPCLVTDDGEAIFDSRVICEYLDTIGEAASLFPTSGTHRWVRVQVMHALADGVMEACVLRRYQSILPREAARDAFMARQKAAADRGLARLESGPPEGLSDIGAIAVACALGYLDFRFPQDPWREGHPRLAAWFERVSTLAPLARTVPRPL